MTIKQNLITALAWTLPLAGVKAQPTVTNLTTSVYAAVRDPLSLSFAADGTLYVGRDNSGSGGGAVDAVKIHRVAPGGSPVTEFGSVSIADPDVVLVDFAGVISGTAGAVLVGGGVGSSGKISKVNPDGTVSTLFGPSSEYQNPSGFAFDLTGRFLFACYDNGRVYATDGGTPVLLFSLTHANYVEVDSLNRIVVNSADNTQLRLYTASGVLSNASFATVKAGTPLARGPGGAWGTDIYAVAPNGDLIRIDVSGVTTRLGSGFGNVASLAFGPDGALHASEFPADRIYRFAQPIVPGGQTTVYARLSDPVRLSFAPDGMLFVGRDNIGSGGGNTDAARIHRVGPGGTPVSEYGQAAITDPDGVFYDATGQFSGTPGAVLVAGTEYNTSSGGKIVEILPDGTVTPLFGPTGFIFNPNLLVFDGGAGRLLITDDLGGKVWVMTNGTPVVLFTLANALHLAVDSRDRIVLGATGSPTLRLYNATGTLLTNAFASVAADSPLASGPGGWWGTGVYCVNTNGDLLSLDTNGAATTRGMGFGLPWGMAFGPDGALYVSEFSSDLIWRVAPPDERPGLTILRAGSNAQLAWFGTSNQIYQLQSTTNLPATIWLNEGPPFPGTGSLLSTNVPIGPEPVKMFRLQAGN